MKTSLILAAGVLSLLGMTQSHAQIVWGTAQAIVGDSDVLDNGTPVDAVGFLVYNNTGDTVQDAGTVNNVTFHLVNNATLSDNLDISFGGSMSGTNNYNGAATLSGDYGQVLYGVQYNNTGSAPMTVTLGNLKADQNYEVEVWNANTGNGNLTTQTTLNDEDGNTVDLTGQDYVVGKFSTSTNDSVTFDFYGTPNESNWVGELSAVSLIDLGQVPEPSTWAMIAAGLVGLAAWRRARQA